MKLAPSIVSADLTCLREIVKEIERYGIDFYHVDVMDGHFVPNMTVGPDFVKNLRKLTELPIEAHLMISRPELYVKRFEESGADMITVHIETENFREALRSIVDAKKGIAINPETPLHMAGEYFGDVDIILIMTVHPGFSGQKFITSMVDKIRELKKIRDEGDYRFEIAVDGGINKETVKFVKNYVDIICAASGIFSGRLEENIRALKYDP
ncbi:MAG: ribulose-phosphate 3-epimerase [Thermoplasmata archaeon]|jgi:ribulose-phosphate 3-epimerase|nr:ribulose-phosphate 3-epimerase [Thermoplasmatales archaeon]PMP75044.1 MAG: ribulose-phosphate 3-epimerase [Aciduliprofundum sp.]HEU12864.1 ribulose-phosphate 3-epimerase [Euryarchaeota archaeon]